MCEDATARRRHTAASIHDPFVAQNMGHGGTVAATAQRLAVGGALASCNQRAWPLPGKMDRGCCLLLVASSF